MIRKAIGTAIRKAYIGSGFYLFHALIRGFILRMGRSHGKDFIKTFCSDMFGAQWVSKNCIRMGGKNQGVVVDTIVKRPKSQRVSEKEGLLKLCVPEDKSKGALQFTNEVRPVRGVCQQQNGFLGTVGPEIIGILRVTKR